MIDEKIKPIVDALNNAGIKTIASCDGHGFQPGTVIIDYHGEEKEIRLFTFEQARKIDKCFPDINGNIRNIYQKAWEEFRKRFTLFRETGYMLEEWQSEMLDKFLDQLEQKHGIKDKP